VARTDAANSDSMAMFHCDFKLIPWENLGQPLAKGSYQSLHLILVV
jgi:hypothetical protein